MRLLDQVRLGQFIVWPSIKPLFQDLISNGLSLAAAVPVDITNVFDWMESDWKITKDSDKFKQVYSYCADLRPSFESTWFEWKMNSIQAAGSKQIKTDGRAVWAVENTGFPGWTMLLFDRQDGKVILSHIFGIRLEDTTAESIAFVYPENEDVDAPDWNSGFLSYNLVPVILAQNLMHCKNIKVERTEMPPKLAKKFAKRNGNMRPAMFRTVKIEPMKKVMTNCGSVQGVGVQKAMHIVRGHFAEYTAEKPLLGHYVGKVFRSQHVRGDEKLGVRTPDYAVVRPAKTKVA